MDWAHFIPELVDPHSPHVEKIRLVLANRHTHTTASLYDAFTPAEAKLLFYQFTRPSVAVSSFSGNPLGLFDSFSVRLLRGQGPQNATHGDRDSSPGDPPNARADDRTGT